MYVHKYDIALPVVSTPPPPPARACFIWRIETSLSFFFVDFSLILHMCTRVMSAIFFVFSFSARVLLPSSGLGRQSRLFMKIRRILCFGPPFHTYVPAGVAQASFCFAYCRYNIAIFTLAFIYLFHVKYFFFLYRN